MAKPALNSMKVIGVAADIDNWRCMRRIQNEMK